MVVRLLHRRLADRHQVAGRHRPEATRNAGTVVRARPTATSTWKPRATGFTAGLARHAGYDRAAARLATWSAWKSGVGIEQVGPHTFDVTQNETQVIGQPVRTFDRVVVKPIEKVRAPPQTHQRADVAAITERIAVGYAIDAGEHVSDHARIDDEPAVAGAREWPLGIRNETAEPAAKPASVGRPLAKIARVKPGAGPPFEGLLECAAEGGNRLTIASDHARQFPMQNLELERVLARAAKDRRQYAPLLRRPREIEDASDQQSDLGFLIQAHTSDP